MPCLQVILLIENSLNVLLWIAFFLYFAVIVSSWIGWRIIPELKVAGNRNHVSVSVIIAARNEEENIPYILSDLKKQTYLKSFTEIIVVDDHSDFPVSKMKCFTSSDFENIRIFRLQNEMKGKKHALRFGVEKSTGELIIFTDADCRLKPTWIENMVSHYLKNESSLIIGLVDSINQKGFWAKFFRFDFMSLIISGAGFASIGFPVMCNGANMAVTREEYFKHILSIRDDIPSGDDMFLLHAIKKSRSTKVSINKSKDSIVFTNNPSSLKEFLNQRIRWASKSKYYNDRDTVLLALIVFFSNLGLIGQLVFSVLTSQYYGLMFLFLIKTIADCFIITAGLSFFGKKGEILIFPLFTLIYPFYILLVTVLSFTATYSWKGRVAAS